MPDVSGTIVAEATPPGRGGVRIVRLSGPLAKPILQRFFRPSGEAPWEEARRLCFGDFLGVNGEVVDRGLAVLFRTPHSFTGEDVAEFHGHGSAAVVTGLLSACAALGARPALAGEFSYRAFLNGKLSLPEAEALDALTRAETALQLEAVQGVSGFTRELSQTRQSVLELMAEWEARLDFPEDISELKAHERSGALAEILATLEALLDQTAAARPLREGWRVALCGAPNVGKSSIFNALLKRERAIVTPHPGTTRDLIEETLDLAGLPIVLIDTAGMRKARDPVEALGVARAVEAASEADGALLLFSRAEGWGGQEAALLAQLGPRVVAVVETKVDLAVAGSILPCPSDALPVSAITGAGLEALSKRLAEWASGSLPASGAIAANSRQLACLCEAASACRQAEASLAEGESEEVALQDLRAAMHALDDLLGGGDPEALYDRIFSAFCIGK